MGARWNWSKASAAVRRRGRRAAASASSSASSDGSASKRAHLTRHELAPTAPACTTWRMPVPTTSSAPSDARSRSSTITAPALPRPARSGAPMPAPTMPPGALHAVRLACDRGGAADDGRAHQDQAEPEAQAPTRRSLSSSSSSAVTRGTSIEAAPTSSATGRGPCPGRAARPPRCRCRGRSGRRRRRRSRGGSAGRRPQARSRACRPVPASCSESSSRHCGPDLGGGLLRPGFLELPTNGLD